jgi:glycerol-3-phosphate dehydrogenase
MADDKSKAGKQDRDRVAGGQDYEVQYLAKDTGVTAEQARQLIKAYGNDREKLMKAAKAIAPKNPNVRSSRV